MCLTAGAFHCRGERFVTDAEALQEILHRYAIEKADVLRAAEIAQHRGKFSARDALHIATMQRMKVKSILSFDSDFDRWPGLTRIHRM